jgi:cytochrome c553
MRKFAIPLRESLAKLNEDREFIKQELDSLNDEELKQVADFIASVKHRSQNLDAHPWQL